MHIEIKDVSRRFGDHKVLDRVSLTIEQGTTCVIIGRSGCGKSVLLKHIIGLLMPQEGKVFVGGTDISTFTPKQMSEYRLKIAMVFQGGALFDSMTVGENVGFGLIEHQHMKGKALLERIEESLAMVGLCGIANLMPSELSGGMKKRVALARAISMRPEIVLYDEPTTGVDPITSGSINELINGLHDKLKVTSVVVTHDMTSAYAIADRIAMLYQGKIIGEGTPEEIQHTQHPVVHQFVNGLAKGPITETLDRFK